MAAYKDQIENVQKKGTKNLITAKTVFDVQEAKLKVQVTISMM